MQDTQKNSKFQRNGFSLNYVQFQSYYRLHTRSDNQADTSSRHTSRVSYNASVTSSFSFALVRGNSFLVVRVPRAHDQLVQDLLGVLEALHKVL